MMSRRMARESVTLIIFNLRFFFLVSTVSCCRCSFSLVFFFLLFFVGFVSCDFRLFYVALCFSWRRWSLLLTEHNGLLLLDRSSIMMLRFLVSIGDELIVKALWSNVWNCFFFSAVQF